ncbi:MAG: proton-conducting transporter membrane subunit [candidate division WOR-3 bacterium]
MVNPIWIIALTLLAIFIMPILGYINRKISGYFAFLPLFFNVYVSISLLLKQDLMPAVVTTGKFWPPITINLVTDYFSLLFLILINVLAVFVLLSHHAIRIESPKFYTLFLLNILGANGIILTGDLFNSFVFLEIMAISSYALAASRKEHKALEGSIKYMITGSIGSSLFLLGTFLLYRIAGSLNMAHIAGKIQGMENGLVILAGILIMVGLAVDAELFPMNGWAPDVYQGSYSSVNTQFSSITSKATLYLLFRIFFTVINIPVFFKILMYLGIITFILSELIATVQRDLKRMLGYSSMGQMGLSVFLFGLYGISGHPESLFAAILVAINHAISKLLLFSSIAHHGDNTNIEDLKGLGTANFLNGKAFTIGTLSILGFPLLLGFWSKIETFAAILRTGKIWLLILVALIFIAEAFYYIRFLSIYLAKDERRICPIPQIALVSFILVLILLIQGVYPVLTLKLANQALLSLFNKGLYISIPMGGF